MVLPPTSFIRSPDQARGDHLASQKVNALGQVAGLFRGQEKTLSLWAVPGSRCSVLSMVKPLPELAKHREADLSTPPETCMPRTPQSTLCATLHPSSLSRKVTLQHLSCTPSHLIPFKRVAVVCNQTCYRIQAPDSNTSHLYQAIPLMA